MMGYLRFFMDRDWPLRPVFGLLEPVKSAV